MQTTTDTETTVHALVDTDWLEEHLDEPGVRIIEIDVDATSYAAGHIPGAILWNIYTDLKDETFQPVLESSLEDLIRRSGIGSDDIVVFYGYAPALGFWLMSRLGHGQPRILNASRSSWSNANRPLSVTVPSVTPMPCRLDDRDNTVWATKADVLSAIDDPTVSILDVRSDLEYVGERFWPSGGIPQGGRAGRIPSSIHVASGDLVSGDGAFRPRRELEEIFADAIDGRSGELITYCTVGARAATVWFALTHILGVRNVRVYDGSWAEWGMDSRVPIATG